MLTHVKAYAKQILGKFLGILFGGKCRKSKNFWEKILVGELVALVSSYDFVCNLGFHEDLTIAYRRGQK